MPEKVDVLVVGGGTAALEAAIAARQGGAERIVVLEKAAEPLAGGNARYSHTGFRFVHGGLKEILEFVPDLHERHPAGVRIDEYTAEQFTADLLRVTQGRIDAGLAEVLVSDSNAAVHWMLSLGFTWEARPTVLLDDVAYFPAGDLLNPAGGGIGQLRKWYELAASAGVEIRFRSAVTQLLGNSNRVDGARVVSPTDDATILADAVVLCSGGFQASAEKRARYLGQSADLIKVRGSRYNTGEVLEQIIALGARTAGQWTGAHRTPIDASAPEWEGGNKLNRYSYPYGITINARGQRFFDEGEHTERYTYAKTGVAISEQPQGACFQLFDQKTVGLLTDRYQSTEPILADSIAKLASLIGIDAVTLEHTVADFNDAIKDDVPFDPTTLDGRHTTGLEVNKSNWAVALDEPPFVAYPVTAGITFTYGGVAINEHAQVLNTSGEPISGCYASGDIIGLFYHNYPACSGQTRNVVFSRRAATHITSAQ